MAPRTGFEPVTLRLTAACSTVELPRNGNELAPRAASGATSRSVHLPPDGRQEQLLSGRGPRGEQGHRAGVPCSPRTAADSSPELRACACQHARRRRSRLGEGAATEPVAVLAILPHA